MIDLKPSMCKSEGPLTVCDCTDTGFRKEQKKCLTYTEGKKGHCVHYRSSIGACSNYDGHFSNIENR